MTKAIYSRMRTFALALAFAAAVIPMNNAFAKLDWDRAANIKSAAERLGALHKREGSPGVVKFLDACYKTQLLSPEFNKGLEECLVDDYIHSKILAEIYARIPVDERAKRNAPSPEGITQAMSQRFGAAISQYKLPASEAETFKKLVDAHGLPVFLKAVFPKSGDTGKAGASAHPDIATDDKDAGSKAKKK